MRVVANTPTTQNFRALESSKSSRGLCLGVSRRVPSANSGCSGVSIYSKHLETNAAYLKGNTDDMRHVRNAVAPTAAAAAAYLELKDLSRLQINFLTL